jgi:hypothetical protein
MGIPLDAKNEKIIDGKTHYSVVANPDPTFVYVKAMKRVPKEGKTLNRRLVGKVGEKDAVGSIVGMSGGPIIGIVAGFREFRVVAVQSSWFEGTRTIFACPMETFVGVVKRELRKLSK